MGLQKRWNSGINRQRKDKFWLEDVRLHIQLLTDKDKRRDELRLPSVGKSELYQTVVFTEVQAVDCFPTSIHDDKATWRC